MAPRKTPNPRRARLPRAIVPRAQRRRIARRLPLTEHALERAAQRNVSMRDVQYVLCFGRAWQVRGGLQFMLMPKHAERRPSARGVIVAYRKRFVRTVMRRGR